MSTQLSPTEWFGDGPTSVSLLKKTIINGLVAALTLIALGICDSPGHCVGLVGTALFVANIVVMVCYGQLRDRDRQR